MSAAEAPQLLQREAEERAASELAPAAPAAFAAAAAAPSALPAAVCEAAPPPCDGCVRLDVAAAAPRACVVCLEPLAAPHGDGDGARADDGDADSDDAPQLPPRSALPAGLPCGHACCASCLHRYLRGAVPRAARAAGAAPPALAAGAAPLPLRVLCPGLLPEAAAAPAAAAAWDMRCPTALPPALLAPHLPVPDPAAAAARALAAAAAPAAPPQRAASGVQQLLDAGRSEVYLALRTRPCAWCGARSQRSGGCAVMRCAACGRDWCYGCGSREPRACLCAAEDGAPVADAIRWARAARGRPVAAALRWPAVALFALVIAPPLYLVLVVAIGTHEAHARMADAGKARAPAAQLRARCEPALACCAPAAPPRRGAPPWHRTRLRACSGALTRRVRIRRVAACTHLSAAARAALRRAGCCAAGCAALAGPAAALHARAAAGGHLRGLSERG
jgi:hypothetical protein